MYSIKEIYKTIQGEGAQSGQSAVFVRFSGCNLWSGKIIFKKKIKFLKSTKFEEIRSINTINCNKLVIQYLNYFKRGKKILALKQKKKGRYYSAIPANLIDTCIVNFNNYINKIKRL